MTLRIEDTVTVTNLPIIGWDNVVSETNVQAESDPDFPASNVANSSLALKWKHDLVGSPASAVEYFTIDTAQSHPLNYIAIAGHNFSTAGIAVGIELASAGSPIGSAEGVFEPQIPIDDGPLIFLFTEREVEGVNITFVPTATAAEIAVLYIGSYTVLEEGIQADHSPLPLARRNNVVLGQSENGTFLGRIRIGEWHESSATIANLSASWVRSDLVPFLDFAAEEPFFYAWSPSTYPNETAFAYIDNDPVPVFDIDGYGRIDLAMKGVVG